MLKITLFIIYISIILEVYSQEIELSVVHINDFHSRFEETDLKGRKCKSESCVGGFSRLFRQIKELKQNNPNTILLNAGDNFQGTIWYNIHKWKALSYFLNKLPFDAFTLGNHEFDDGVNGVIPFIQNLSAPVLVSNIDDSLEPGFQNIIKKSTIIQREGKKIGLIGVITKYSQEISNSGKLIFLDESESINAEAERLVKEENVFTNLIISHTGYDVDKLMASKATNKISLIVGGHSHSYLGDSDLFESDGPYPTVVKRESDGGTVLIVQASSAARHVGNISIKYDQLGNILNFTGEAIFLAHELSQDETINEELLTWKIPIDLNKERVLGKTSVPLTKAICKLEECLWGNFVTDAMVYSYINQSEGNSWNYAAIALFNPGGFRSNIEVGAITFEDMLTAQPFENTFDVSDIKGRHIKEIFELVAGSNFTNGNEVVSIRMLQVSGVHVILDLYQPIGKRVKSLKLRCSHCMIPTYEDLNPDETYRIITPSFLTNGGDGFTVISENIFNTKKGEKIDMEILEEYLEKYSPIFKEIYGRIEIIGQETVQSKHIKI